MSHKQLLPRHAGHRVRLWVLLYALLFAIAAPTHGQVQAPKPGKYYEDVVDLGFKIKRPAEWDVIPPQPGEPNLVAKFTPHLEKYVLVNGKALYINAFLVKFDRRKKAAAEPRGEGTDPKPSIGPAAKRDVAAWVAGEFSLKFKPVGPGKDTVVNKVPAKVLEWTGPEVEDPSGRIKAWVFQLQEDLDIAFVAVYPGAPKKAAKWEDPYEQMARSFAKIELRQLGTEVKEESDLRSKRRAELELEVAKSGGDWKLYETPNYFILTPHKDKQFIKELQERLEAIRKIYEIDYPYEKAQELRAAGKTLRTGGGVEDEGEKDEGEKDEGEKDEGEKDEDEDEDDAEDEEKGARGARPTSEADLARRILGDADPRELSRCSVVRVLTDQEAYHSYGGPRGSAGYWFWVHQELVLYDDQKGGGRNDTWLVLNHEAFHQYIFYLYGSISPHSWYNEGTGDYYSGYKWKSGRFEQEKAAWRVETIRELIRDDRFVPLADLVRFTQQEYYGQNKHGASGLENYAQGWSFVYFLRTGKKKGAKNWNADWDKILEKYFKSLAMTGSLNQAVEEAFRGIDMEALTDSWKDYIVTK